MSDAFVAGVQGNDLAVMATEALTISVVCICCCLMGKGTMFWKM
jgi:hypothetical protein